MKSLKDVYVGTLSSAKIRNEEALFKYSSDENMNCAADIDNHLKICYDTEEHILDSSAAAKAIIEKYGFERLGFVLSNYVSAHDYDGRISRSNKEWAASTVGKFYGAEAGNITAHPGLVDMLINNVRHIEREKQNVDYSDLDEYELAKLLSENARREYTEFLEYLKTLPPEQILDYAYEKVTCEDILQTIEEHGETLSKNELLGLLKVHCPIETVYNEWLKYDQSEYMESLLECVSSEGKAIAQSCDISEEPELEAEM